MGHAQGAHPRQGPGARRQRLRGALADLLDLDQRRRLILPVVGGRKLLLRAHHRDGQRDVLARRLEVGGIPLARHPRHLVVDQAAAEQLGHFEHLGGVGGEAEHEAVVPGRQEVYDPSIGERHHLGGAIEERAILQHVLPGALIGERLAQIDMEVLLLASALALQDRRGDRAGCRRRADLEHRRAQGVEPGEGHRATGVPAMQAHLLKQAIDDTQQVLVVVDGLMRAHGALFHFLPSVSGSRSA